MKPTTRRRLNRQTACWVGNQAQLLIDRNFNSPGGTLPENAVSGGSVAHDVVEIREVEASYQCSVPLFDAGFQVGITHGGQAPRTWPGVPHSPAAIGVADNVPVQPEAALPGVDGSHDRVPRVLLRLVQCPSQTLDFVDDVLIDEQLSV